jgi:23S rRNA (pseudouridine1915-N3)-methyltransferase
MLKIMCVGSLKEAFYKEAEKEYLKRLSKYTKLEVIEISEEKEDKEIESKKIMDRIDQKEYLILLDISGREYDSIELADKIDKLLLYGKSNITFIIGGSTGVSDKLKEICNEKISFSKLTFPHQLFRIILLEQIYRSFKIINKETYHK